MEFSTKSKVAIEFQNNFFGEQPIFTDELENLPTDRIIRAFVATN